MSTYDQISSGFNFQNVAVDYRYGSETNQPISGFSDPINQKQINFSLLGKTNPGVNLGATKVVADPLFEEFDEVRIFNSNQGVYQNPDLSNATKLLPSVADTPFAKIDPERIIRAPYSPLYDPTSPDQL